ncbi:MAG: assembly factor cbp4 [Thelocarpon superellum]|nr:MAG: assembly factor cbp4 [Thelocarpon superellum]
MCIGGPALIYWVTPTEEELFKKYNPDLQKRSLANRQARQQDFDDFVGQLKEYSKSDKPIWEAAAEGEARKQDMARRDRTESVDEIQKRREEIKREFNSPT